MPLPQHGLGSRHQEGQQQEEARRNDDSSAIILGQDLQIDAADVAAVQDTEDYEKVLNTMRDYRNRLQALCEWMQQEFPDYVELGGVVPITDAQKSDRVFFAYKSTLDLRYDGLNVRIIKTFMSKRKLKADGKIYSHVHLRKYRDAILWGAEKAFQTLPSNVRPQLKKFLESYLKETKKAKQNNMLDEEESDPIPFGLYRKICNWSINDGELLVWVFTVLQWNCIARSVSIDQLGFHNLSAGEDSIRVTYDLTKMDQGGKNMCPKNLFANPHDSTISFHFALGVWLSLNNDKLLSSEKFFSSGNAEQGRASQNYNKALVKLLKKRREEVAEFVRVDHCNSHGNRKGGAIHVTTCTTAPPPMPSVLIRGDWSMGKVLDIYWKFGDAGDCYAGRILAGLSCDDPEFATLPPHFGDDDDGGNLIEGINEGIAVCFGFEVVSKYKDYRWLFHLLLASIVYHSDFTEQIIADVPNHPFAGLPLRQATELLTYLKKYVTIKPSRKMKATGVPPHVKQLKILSVLIDQTQSILKALSNLLPQMRESIAEAIENASINGGHVTPKYLQSLIAQVTAKIDGLDRRFCDVEGLIREGVQIQQPQGTSATVFDSNTPDQWRYCYEGRFYSVPRGFELPMRLKLRAAFGLWINGDPSRKSYQKLPGKSEVILTATPIKPYRMIKPTMLPKEVACKFRVSWMPILKLMTSGNNNLPALATGKALDDLYNQGLGQIMSNAAYIFAKGGDTDWAISTWSRKILPSAIKNNGTSGDKARLGRIPVPHQRKRKRKATIENNGQQRLILAPAQQQLIPVPVPVPVPVPGDCPRPTSTGLGYCSIRGCRCPLLNHDHPCFRQGCSCYVHNTCAQWNHLLDGDNELNMYCSSTCKKQARVAMPEELNI
jgi:hypothetical protein